MTGQALSTPTSLSPMENLSELFAKQNEQLEMLISRLTSKLHRLSDTNLPTETGVCKSGDTDLPFRDGHLMTYYNQLKRNEYLIGCLSDQVNKTESLI